MNLCVYVVVVTCLCLFFIECKLTPCTTPNGEEAFCTSLLSCTVLQVASGSEDPTSKKFLEASTCPQEILTVCCGTHANFTTIPENPTQSLPNPPNDFNSTEARRDYVVKNLLPSKTYCGRQHTDDYFYNGTQTSVDEFPWMGHLPFSGGHINTQLSSRVLGCVGALISNRYVLTHKYCEIKPWYKFRLGQHHIYEAVSCIGTPFGQDDCTDPPLEIKVSDFITSDESVIALLRLEEEVFYTDYIRPICLPIKESERPTGGDTIFTSGWSDEEYLNGQYVKIRKRLNHTVLSQDDCEKGNPIANPICAVTRENSDRYVCPKDNGGPIMYKHRNNWFVEGVITGSTSCSKYQPLTGERLTEETINWIIDNLKP